MHNLSVIKEPLTRYYPCWWNDIEAARSVCGAGTSVLESVLLLLVALFDVENLGLLY